MFKSNNDFTKYFNEESDEGYFLEVDVKATQLENKVTHLEKKEY